VSREKAFAGEYFAVREGLEALVVMLAPFSPHIAEEMWEALGHEGGMLKSARWPQFNSELAQEDIKEFPVLTNKKVRGRFYLPPDSSPEMLEEEAIVLADRDERLGKWLEDQERPHPKAVPGSQVNIVIGQGSGDRTKLNKEIFTRLVSDALNDLSRAVINPTMDLEAQREEALRHLYSKLLALVGSGEVPLVTLQGSTVENLKRRIALYSFHHSASFFRTEPLVEKYVAKALDLIGGMS